METRVDAQVTMPITMFLHVEIYSKVSKNESDQSTWSLFPGSAV